MGSNPTQAIALLAFMVAGLALAIGFAGGGIIAYFAAVVLVGVALMLFNKCKPWEHTEE